MSSASGSVTIPGTTQLRVKDILTRLLVSKATCIVADPDIAKLVDEVLNYKYTFNLAYILILIGFTFQVAGLVPHLESKIIVGETADQENRYARAGMRKMHHSRSP